MSVRLAAVKASCSACIILITTGRCIGVCRCRTSDFFAVQIKFHNRSITVNYNLCLAAVIKHDLIFIPYRENMKGIFVVIPLALIQIIGIFWDTCRVNDTKVRVLCNVRPGSVCTGSLPVIRCRFTDIIKTCPDKFACIKFLLHRDPQPCTCQMSPAYCTFIIRSQSAVSASIVTVAVLPVVNATAVYGRGCLRTIDQPSSAVSVADLSGASVVKSYQTSRHAIFCCFCKNKCCVYLIIVCPDIALYLIVTKGYISGRIFFSGPGDQFFCHFRILTCYIPVDQLLKDFISKAPHNNGRIVSSSSYHGFEVKFCPFFALSAIYDLVAALNGLVEPFTIILGISCFSGKPAVKGFFHQHDAFTVAHIDQYLGCRVMCYTDGIDSHLF